MPGALGGTATFLTGSRTTRTCATLVERNTRFTMLVKIPRKDTTTVVAALAKHVGKLPERVDLLTWIKAKRCMPISASRLPPTSRLILLTSAQSLAAQAQTETPTACCVSTFREEPASRASLSALSERDCAAAQSTPAKDLGLRNASR